ncbi:hypothetical protein GCM10020000_02920 [Streptomyces olivoverticillatus]
MPRVEVELYIAAPPAQSWAAVVDVESYPECMDSVQSVKVVEQNGPQERTTAWSVHLKGSVLEWVEAERIDDEARRFDFHQVSGDLAHFVGHWAVRPADDGGSLVSLDVEFDIGIPPCSPRCSTPSLPPRCARTPSRCSRRWSAA